MSSALDPTGGQHPDSPGNVCEMLYVATFQTNPPQTWTWIFFKTFNNVAIEVVKLLINIL